MKRRIVLVLIFGIFLGMIIDNIDMKNIKLLKNDISSNNNDISIMVYDDTLENYVRSDSVPIGDYELNVDASYCINGGSISNYDNINGTLEYMFPMVDECYVYFDELPPKLYEYLIDTKPQYLNLTLDAGLYRYQGLAAEVTNNYICFGTSDKSECLSDTSHHLYRIIGITESGQIKIIIDSTMPDKYQWHSSWNTNVEWPSSSLFAALNGSAFYENTSHVPNAWKDKIELFNWKYADKPYYYVTANEVLNTFNSSTKSFDAKVSLAYIHDFMYARVTGGASCLQDANINFPDEVTDCHSWLTKAYEWTMSRHGYLLEPDPYFGDSGLLAFQYGTHIMVQSSATNSLAVRPTFYLIPEVTYNGGTGSSSDPYLII